VSADAAVTDLVRRVRIAAAEAVAAKDGYDHRPRTIDAEWIRVALRRELRRLEREIRADPSTWGAWRDGVDVVGTAYEQLVRGADRRDSGQFQTPMYAAELMAGWLAQREIECLLDPGVGAARLLIASSKQRRVPRRMIGIDTDEVSLAMAQLNMLLRGLDAKLRLNDFLLGRFIERPDAIIANPPYSRHHAIPEWRKHSVHDHLQRRLGVDVSLLAGLHVLFFMRAIEVLGDGGRLAFITPLPWLDVNYGREVKRYVLEHAHVDGLIVFDDRERVFPGAKTTATITLLTKGESAAAGDAPTRVVRIGVEKPPARDVIAALAGRASPINAEPVTLSADEPWSTRPAPKRRPPGRPLPEFARVRRGVATGCKPFYVISEETRRDHGLRVRDLRPCVATPKVVPHLELTTEILQQLPATTPRWLLNTRDPQADRREDALGAYLRLGRDQGADESYLAQHRRPWWGLEQRGSCPILFTYMNKHNPRFIRNRAGAIALNNFLIIEPHDNVDPDALWRALNRRAFIGQLEHFRRAYGGGMWKLERHELDQLRVRL
jgi:hypothetical protein